MRKKLGITVNLVFAESMSDFEARAKTGEFDVIFTNPTIYVRIAPKKNERDNGPVAFAKIIKSPKFGGDKFRGVIVTRSDNNDINSIKDLLKPGVKGMCTAKGSTSGYFSQAAYLFDQEIDPNKDLNLVQAPDQKHNQVAEAVYNKEVDYGFYREDTVEVIARKLDLTQLKTIASTYWVPQWCFCTGNNINSQTAQKIKDVILGIKDENVLKSLKINEIVPAKDSEWNEFRLSCDKIGYKY